MVTLSIVAVLSISIITVYFLSFNVTLRSNYQARLAVESQNILRAIVEELRISSGIHATSMPDAHVIGGAANWSTSNANLVLIIATPAVDNSNEVIFNTSDGTPYMNELVYYATGGKLYKRYLAAPAPGNRNRTSCPPTMATADCPSDVLLSNHFKTMSFVFYDQDDAIINQATGNITLARSIQLNIDMEHKTFGQTVIYNNKIRMTMRNNQ